MKIHLLKIIACPVCYKKLFFDTKKLFCDFDKIFFSVKKGIPILIKNITFI